MVLSTGKIRKCYGLLFAFSLAMMAYIWVPGESSDLFRYHQQMKMMYGRDIWYYGDATKEVFEPVHHFVTFIIAQTGNYDLLQFFGVLLSYSGVTWLICDYADMRKMRKDTFTLTSFFMIVSNGFMFFASSFWCFLAMVCIAVGLYLHYFKKKKYLQYIFYAIAVGLHIGTLYVIVFVLLFSVAKMFRRVRPSLLILVFVCSLTFGAILLWISELLGPDSGMAAMIGEMYEDYFANDSQFKSLHKGLNLLLPFLNSALCLVVALWHSRKKEMREYSSLIAYLAIFVMATMLSAGVFLRFGFLMVIAAAPLFVGVLEETKDKKTLLMFIMAMLTLSCIQAYRSCVKMEESGLTKQINDNAVSSVMTIWGDE